MLYFSVSGMGNIDDQHRNTNMNNKDHLVGQLTTLKLSKYPHFNIINGSGLINKDLSVIHNIVNNIIKNIVTNKGFLNNKYSASTDQTR